MEKIQIIIPNRMSGQRLDSALSELLPNLSRSKINNSIKSGKASINNKSFKPKDKASGNEIICLILDQQENNSWMSEDIPLDLV